MKRNKSLWIIIGIAGSIMCSTTAFFANVKSAISTCRSLMNWLKDKSSIQSNIIIFIIIIFVVILIFFVKKRINKSNSNSGNEDDIRNGYLGWLKIEIKNHLKSSIHNAIFIDLKHIEDAEQVVPWNYRDADSNRDVTYNNIEDVIANNKCRILLLGAPGSGKSTTLLKLADIFCSKAVENKKELIPIWVNLSSWGQTENRNIPNLKYLKKIRRKRHLLDKTPDLATWLIKTLVNTSGIEVTEVIARRWFEEKNIALFLDGFDEASETSRAKIIVKLNDFFEKNPTVTVFVCSRIADYEALVKTTSVKLNLDTAIKIEPLDSIQIENYLKAAKSNVVSSMLKDDEELRNLAKTPLNLCIMVLAYEGLKTIPPKPNGMLSGTFSRIYLFSAFVKSMMQKKARRDISSLRYPESDFHKQDLKTEYKEEEVNKYLGWFAKRMCERSRTSLDLNNLYQFLWQDDSGKIWSPINIANGILISICTFFLVFILTKINSAESSILKSMIFSIGSFGCYFLIDWMKDRFEDTDCFKVTVGNSFLIFSLWLIIIPISAYILGGLNYIFPNKMWLPILVIVTMIILNILLSSNNDPFYEMNSYYKMNSHYKMKSHYIIKCMLCNLFITSAIAVAFEIVEIWNFNANISFILSILLIEYVVSILTREYEEFNGNGLIILILVCFFGAILSGLINPNLVVIGPIILIVPSLYWIKLHDQIYMNIIGTPLVKLVLKFQGNIPFRFNRFINYACDALLIQKNHNKIEFMHRQLRDYFAIKDKIYSFENQDENQRRLVIEELINLNDASCDIFLELIEDNDKQVRLACIRGLGFIGSTVAAQTLINIIKRAGEGLQDEAFAALEKVRDIGSIPILVNLLRTYPKDSKMYKSVIKILCNMNELGALDDVSEIKYWLYNGTSDEQFAAVCALIKLDEKGYMPDFIDQVEKGNYRLLTVLGTFDSNIALKEIMELIRKGKANSKIGNELTSLKIKGAKINEDEILSIVQNQDIEKQKYSVEMLTYFKSKKVVPFLLKLRDSKDLMLRDMARGALIETHLKWRFIYFMKSI